MNGRKRIAVLTSAAIIAAGSGPVAAGSASAATCYGDYCSNKDPQTTGCAAGGWTQHAIDVYYHPYVWSNKGSYAGRLELRGSTACGSTQWGRFTPVNGGFSYRIQAQQPETGYTTDWQNANAWQTAWTNQIYSPKKCVRIRIDIHDAYPQTVYTHCL